MARAKEIESDGFITREEYLASERRTCYNCKWFQYSLINKRYACFEGHSIGDDDWRKKYDCCDKWERINDMQRM